MTSEHPADAPPAPRYWLPPPLRWYTTVAIVGLTIAAVLAVLDAWGLWPFEDGIETTDDAYVHGFTTVIAPRVSGYVVAVFVIDYAHVRKDQVLILIDDRPYRARVDQARADLANAEFNLDNNRQAHASGVASLQAQQATLERSQADMARAVDLVKDGSISVRERDETKAVLAQSVAQVKVAQENIRAIDVAREGLVAQVASSRAVLEAAQLDLYYTVVKAPDAGQLSEVGVRLGQYVTNGTVLMSLVPPYRWVVADYKEAQTSHMALGQAASFTVDALAGRKFVGRIEQLSPATGSEFAVLKPDNATGNFVKVPQRIGVRIGVDPGQPMFDRLRPGMSVVSRVDTKGGP